MVKYRVYLLGPVPVSEARSTDRVQYPWPKTQCRAACDGLQKILMIEVRWGEINATPVQVAGTRGYIWKGVQVRTKNPYVDILLQDAGSLLPCELAGIAAGRLRMTRLCFKRSPPAAPDRKMSATPHSQSKNMEIVYQVA